MRIPEFDYCFASCIGIYCTQDCDNGNCEKHGECVIEGGKTRCNCIENYQDNDNNLICMKSCSFYEESVCDSILECNDYSEVTCDFNNNNGYNGVKTVNYIDTDDEDISSSLKFYEYKLFDYNTQQEITMSDMFIGGNFKSSKLDCDLDDLTETHQLTNTGKTDIFITKIGIENSVFTQSTEPINNYNYQKKYLWSYQIKGSDEQILKDFAICNGEVYLVGIFKGRTYFSSTVMKNNNGGYDSFITKIDNWGNHQWTKTIGGNEDDIINAITTDSECNVYVTGGFNSDSVLIFDGREITEHDGMDLFISKYDSNGNIIEERRFGVTTTCNELNCDYEGKTILLKDNLVYVGGYKSVDRINKYHKDVLLLELDIYLRESSEIDLTNLNTDTPVLKYEDIITKLTVDNLGNIWVTGNNKISDNLNTEETFIGKLNIVKNSKSNLNPNYINNGKRISINNLFSFNDELYFCGYFNGNIDFDISGGSDLVDSGQDVWVYLTKMTNETNYEWTHIIESVIKLSTATEPNSFENLRDIPCSIYVKSDDFMMGKEIYLYGVFQGLTDFYPTTDKDNITTSSDKTDIFLWRYKENQ